MDEATHDDTNPSQVMRDVLVVTVARVLRLSLGSDSTKVVESALLKRASQLSFVIFPLPLNTKNKGRKKKLTETALALDH